MTTWAVSKIIFLESNDSENSENKIQRRKKHLILENNDKLLFVNE